MKLPRTYQWNDALEQSLGSNESVSVTYLGAIGHDLLRGTNLLDPNPNFDFVAVTGNTATSDYHAFQLKFQRQLSKGLQALASYTFSHTIDISSTDAVANYLNTAASIANPNVDRGDSDLDIRHSFTGALTYNIPTPGSQKVVHCLLGDCSRDTFVLARTAPPDDIVGAIVACCGHRIPIPARTSCQVSLLCSMDRNIRAARFSIKRHLRRLPRGQQGDLGRNVLRGFGVLASRFRPTAATSPYRRRWASFPR